MWDDELYWLPRVLTGDRLAGEFTFDDADHYRPAAHNSPPHDRVEHMFDPSGSVSLMSTSPALQGSLLDATEQPALGSLSAIRRTVLGRGAWLDVLRGWLAGADALFSLLAKEVPWRGERRQMYDREVDVPRLLAWYGESDALPHPILAEAKAALNEHYAPEPFETIGLCYYRDGRDSVAWHGDRIGRGATEDTMVAILSVGTPRPLLLRPRGGGVAIRHALGHGDLIVMGGSCQRTWEHAVPKTAKPVGPRISIQFRPVGVR